MRRNIALDYGRDLKNPNISCPTIYFYTHWGGMDLEDDLRQALIRGTSRWNDPPYLARIIFSQMIQHDLLDVVGFGIDVDEFEPDYPTINVDLKNRTVDGVPFADFIAAAIPARAS